MKHYKPLVSIHSFIVKKDNSNYAYRKIYNRVINVETVENEVHKSLSSV